MPRFPSAQGRLNHEPDSTLAVTKTCPKDGVHLWDSPGFSHSSFVRLSTCETGSLETAPTASQSPGCSHSGIAWGQSHVLP